MEITKEIIEKSELLNEGTTCYIMRYGNSITYKIYKGAIGYVNGVDEYGLDEIEVLNRLNYIVSKQHDVTLTDLPSDMLICNGKPVGVIIGYYKDCIPLEEFLLTNSSVEYITIVKQQMTCIVDELIKNGIVPTDPHFGNFLVRCNDDGTIKLNMIDTDDQYISIYPDDKKDVWYESQVNACYMVIDLSFARLNVTKGK